MRLIIKKNEIIETLPTDLAGIPLQWHEADDEHGDTFWQAELDPLEVWGDEEDDDELPGCSDPECECMLGYTSRGDDEDDPDRKYHQGSYCY